MQQYIEQLLEDLKNAERPEGPLHVYESNRTFEQDMEEVERWLERDEPEHTFSYYCGLKKDIFPPAERLSQDQLAMLVKGVQKLLYSWNLGVDMPAELELDKTYNLITSVLDRKTEIVQSGFITFEFCNYDVPSCPFGQHCMCKKYDVDFRDESEPLTDRL